MEEEKEKKINEDDYLSGECKHTGKEENEFTGIDMLISTPESMNDLRIRLDEARKAEAEIMLKANEAHEEVCKLERLVKYFESKPVACDSRAVEECQGVETTSVSGSAASSDNRYIAGGEKKHVCNERHASDADTSDDEDMDEDYYRKRRLKFWLFVVAGGILLAAVSILIYRYVSDDTPESIEVIYGGDSVDEDSLMNEEESLSDSLDSGAEQSSGLELRQDKIVKPVEEKSDIVNKDKGTGVEKVTNSSKSVTKRSVPSTYTIQKGETLFGISKKFYGTIDSIDAIIRVNNFKNPNSISYGTTIKLP